MEYLVINYDLCVGDKPPFSERTMKLVSEKELFEIFQNAKDNQRFPKIAVYPVADNPVIDWS